MKLPSFLIAISSLTLAHVAAAQPSGPPLPPPPTTPVPSSLPPPPNAAPPAAPPAAQAAPSAAGPAPWSPPPGTATAPAPPPPYPPSGPYGYPYPPQVWQPQAPRVLALTMAYDPDRGVPPGYKLFEHRQGSFITAGAVTLAALWVVSTVAGGIIEESSYSSDRRGWPMWIPVAGPFITIATARSDSAGTTPLIFDGLGQTAGLALLIAGLVVPKKVLKYQFQPAHQVMLRPTLGPLGGGAYSGVVASF